MAIVRFIAETAQITAHENELVKALGLRPAGPETLDAVLMDTFDGRLVRDGGMVLRRDAADERWELQWTGLGRDVDRGSITTDRENRIDRDGLPPGPVTSRLGQVLGVRALLPLARVEGRVHHWERRDRRGKVVLRARVEPATTIRATRARKAIELPPQIHIIGLQGFEARFEDALRTTRRLTSAVEVTTPWTLDALRAVGHRPGHDPSEIAVELHPTLSSRAAVRDLCAAYVRVIRANREGACAALDPEFLHDFRVATRRLRALLKASRVVWPDELWERFRREFRWLARQTGLARDLDVYVLDFEDFRHRLPSADRAALDPVRNWLETSRERVHADLAESLAGERVDRLLDDFNTLLASRAFAGESATDGDTVVDLAIETIDRAHCRILRDGRRIDEDSPDQALHDLRKRAKELRYLLDGFRDLFPRRRVRRQIKELKALQDNLGLHQDRIVQGGTLRRIALELEGAPATTLVSLGYLIEQLRDDAQGLRRAFATRFAAYAADDRCEDFVRMLQSIRRVGREAAE